MTGFVEAEVYAQLARLGKALSSPIRLRLLDLLDAGERDVEQLSALAGVPLKNTSAQLQVLRAAHLVTTRRDGNRVHYRLADREVSAFLGAFQDLAAHRLADLRDAIVDLLGAVDVVQQITAEELATRLDDPGTLVVDVRDADAYARGHLPHAVSIPAAELVSRLAELPRDADIVAYCQGPYCVLSPDCARLLREHGLRAYPLDGGITRWRRSGQLVDQG